jgi:hypothetical protein
MSRFFFLLKKEKNPSPHPGGSKASSKASMTVPDLFIYFILVLVQRPLLRRY